MKPTLSPPGSCMPPQVRCGGLNNGSGPQDSRMRASERGGYVRRPWVVSPPRSVGTAPLVVSSPISGPFSPRVPLRFLDLVFWEVCRWLSSVAAEAVGLNLGSLCFLTVVGMVFFLLKCFLLVMGGVGGRSFLLASPGGSFCQTAWLPQSAAREVAFLGC